METETEREAERIVLYCIVGQIFTNFFKQMTSLDFICTIQLNCIVFDLHCIVLHTLTSFILQG